MFCIYGIPVRVRSCPLLIMSRGGIEPPTYGFSIHRSKTTELPGQDLLFSKESVEKVFKEEKINEIKKK